MEPSGKGRFALAVTEDAEGSGHPHGWKHQRMTGTRGTPGLHPLPAVLRALSPHAGISRSRLRGAARMITLISVIGVGVTLVVLVHVIGGAFD